MGEGGRVGGVETRRRGVCGDGVSGIVGEGGGFTSVIGVLLVI